MARKRKSLLKKHSVEQAAHQRTCKNTGRKIAKGERCLVVLDSQFKRANYSTETGLLIIEDARNCLNQLLAALNGKE